jgi:hypothetical protein
MTSRLVPLSLDAARAATTRAFLAGDEWWVDVTLTMLEVMRLRLRGLVRFVEKTRQNPIYRGEVLGLHRLAGERGCAASLRALTGRKIRSPDPQDQIRAGACCDGDS